MTLHPTERPGPAPLRRSGTPADRSSTTGQLTGDRGGRVPWFGGRLNAENGTSARDHLARRDRGRTGVPWCGSASVASSTRIVAFRNLGLVGQRVALPPGSQPYGDSDYARNDEPRPQRPEIARPDERQRLAKGYHDEDPRALGESLDGIHAHTYCRIWSASVVAPAGPMVAPIRRGERSTTGRPPDRGEVTGPR